MILPDFLWRVQKTTNKKFWTWFAENFHNFSKKSRQKMRNKHIMIFQTAVRKYVDMWDYENIKIKSDYQLSWAWLILNPHRVMHWFIDFRSRSISTPNMTWNWGHEFSSIPLDLTFTFLATNVRLNLRSRFDFRSRSTHWNACPLGQEYFPLNCTLWCPEVW